MRYVFLIFCAVLFFANCQKEKISEPPPPPPEPPVYVPIYQPGDTSMGAGYAKKLTADWKAEALCRVQTFFDTNYISIGFFTYSSYGELRETFGFSFIPRFEDGIEYGLKKMVGSSLQPGYISPTYGTMKYDGDVTEDIYYLDTTATDNYFRVDKIDPVSKRIEGSFSVTFKVEEPRSNPANPPTVKFSAGRYWAIIQE